MENPNNRIVAVGRLDGPLELSHEVMNEPFYTGTLLVKRLSGAMDRLPVTVPGKLLSGEEDGYDGLMMVQGQVRSYNKVIEGAGRLMVTLFAQSIAPCEENDTLNKVSITGALCRPPVYRATPFGREICDMMLAVNRAFGKSDYIPCIAWGRNAQYASRFNVGDRVRLTGRLQSREYQKLLDSGEYMLRMAYEVSAFTLEADDSPEIFRMPLRSGEEYHGYGLARGENMGAVKADANESAERYGYESSEGTGNAATDRIGDAAAKRSGYETEESAAEASIGMRCETAAGKTVKDTLLINPDGEAGYAFRQSTYPSVGMSGGSVGIE